MPEVYKVSCECGKHDFVFAHKPWTDTEVKCPECKKSWVIKGDAPKEPTAGAPKVLEPKAAKEASASTAATTKKDGDK